MLTILRTLLSTATGALGGIYGYVAVAVVAATVAGSGAGWLTHKVDLTKYQALELKDAKGVTVALEAQAEALRKVAATQHAVDMEATQGAVAEAAAQNRIITRTITVTQEVPHYVTVQADAVSCIPYGLVRVLDAAALAGPNGSVSPGDLALPAGQSDDACSPVKASVLAASVVANYGTAAQNAEQLNALEAWVHQLIETANK